MCGDVIVCTINLKSKGGKCFTGSATSTSTDLELREDFMNYSYIQAFLEV